MEASRATGLGPGKAPRQGMTLVEVLITILVLTVGCFAARRMQSAATRGNAIAEHMAVASILADSEMERLRSLGRSDLANEAALGQKVETSLDRNGQSCPQAGPCPGLRYSRTVTFHGGVPTSLSTLVEVEVSWRDLAGRRSVVQRAALTR
ncbi:MAG: prepilin-type N-terminal cleavage/methylation domain-containing protein, partial [Deltaproteobacteria bacterium]|nr:prepilin-type N-terminal cleavage/methylation domain-containing protein [Deltaproteobacteria bacterium]